MSNGNSNRPPNDPNDPNGPAGPAGSSEGPLFGGDDSWRQHEFGEGQSRYYDVNASQVPQPYGSVPPQGPGGQRPQQGGPGQGGPGQGGPAGPGPAGGGGKSRAPIIAGVVVGALVLAGGGFALAKGLSNDDNPPVADTTAPTSAQTPTGTQTSEQPSPTATDSPSSSDTASSPTKPGEPDLPAGIPSNWQIIQADDDRGYATYALPPENKDKGALDGENTGWESAGEGTTFGLADDEGSPLAVGQGGGDYAKGYCPTENKDTNDTAALAVFQNTGVRQLADAAPDVWQLWAKAINGKDDKDVEDYANAPTPKTITLGDGKTRAVQVQGNIPLSAKAKSKNCNATNIELTTISFPSGGKSPTLVLYRLLGVPQELPTETRDQIFNSIRPAE